MQIPDSDSFQLPLADFTEQGARLHTDPAAFIERARQTEGLLLDWDGVFNAGEKGGGTASAFSEPDSMGLNLLRFGFYLMTGRLLPVAIVTGQDNPAAADFARRERLHALYIKVRDKALPTLHFSERLGLEPQHLACLFDDVNDLPMARACGLRFLVRRPASPMLLRFAAQRQLVDYSTASPSGQYPIRECCELLLALWGVYDRACTERIDRSDSYQTYWSLRQQNPTRRYEYRDDRLLELEGGEPDLGTVF